MRSTPVYLTQKSEVQQIGVGSDFPHKALQGVVISKSEILLE